MISPDCLCVHIGSTYFNILHVASEGLTMYQRRIEGEKKPSSAVTVLRVAARTNRSTRGAAPLLSAVGNGFERERREREPVRPPRRRVVVERDQKARGLRGGRLRFQSLPGHHFSVARAAGQSVASAGAAPVLPALLCLCVSVCVGCMYECMVCA